MNHIDARGIRYGSYYIGQFRRVHKADYETVCINGRPRVFQSEHEAECAAWRVLSGHVNGLMRRDGVTIGENARTEAERLFAGGR